MPARKGVHARHVLCADGSWARILTVHALVGNRKRLIGPMNEFLMASDPNDPSGPRATQLSLRFTHQCHEIRFRVAEENHPQIVIGHFRDYVRLVFEAHAVFFHSGVRCLNVGHGEIKN